jgi:LuxR family quorum sensing-dependent transcriptional regulator
MDKRDLLSNNAAASVARRSRRRIRKQSQFTALPQIRSGADGAPAVGSVHAAPAGGPYGYAAFDYIERLQQLFEPSQIQQAFVAAIGALGVTNFALLEVTSRPEAFQRGVIGDCMPEDWKRRYFEQEYVKVDPCIREAMTNVDPFLWSETLAKSRRTKRMRQIFHEAAEFQLKEGLCIPIYGPGRYQAFATLAGSAIDLAPHSRAALHMMSLYTHNRLLKLVRKPATAAVELTRREIECLQWVSQGKSDWEIGEILKISESTAHWYVECAKHKFGVATRIQAVMSAVSAGLISY